jgi:hypothetical protein
VAVTEVFMQEGVIDRDDHGVDSAVVANQRWKPVLSGLHDLSPGFTLAHRTLATLALGRARFGRRHPATSALLHPEISSGAEGTRINGQMKVE